MGAGGPKVRGHGAMGPKPMGNPWETDGYLIFRNQDRPWTHKTWHVETLVLWGAIEEKVGHWFIAVGFSTWFNWDCSNTYQILPVFHGRFAGILGELWLAALRRGRPPDYTPGSLVMLKSFAEFLVLIRSHGITGARCHPSKVTRFKQCSHDQLERDWGNLGNGPDGWDLEFNSFWNLIYY